MLTVSPATTVPSSAAPLGALVELGNALRKLGYRFITPTPATIALVNQRPGNETARDLMDVFGWSRPFEARILPAHLLALLKEAGMLRTDKGLLRSAVRVSSSSVGDALFFHSAWPTDAVDAVFFGPDTYRFLRQLEAAVPALPSAPARCIDIGCGAGAGAIALARMLPAATIHAVDINPAAVSMTVVNAALAGAVKVIAGESDLLKDIKGQFDLIIANPPYLVDAGKRSYRHGGGVLGGALSLSIVDAAIDRLAPGGSLMLYSASAIVRGIDEMHEAVRARLDGAGFSWSYGEIDPDVFSEELANPAYAQVDRLAAVWLQARCPL